MMRGRKFKQSMLDYAKVILSKMSFDKKLFEKEYLKALKYLDPNECLELKQWVQTEMQWTPHRQ
jgi:hypothetical protein